MKRVSSDEEVERRASYATFILESVCDSFELTSDEAENRRCACSSAQGASMTL